jgi:hypothetical protein
MHWEGGGKRGNALKHNYEFFHYVVLVIVLVGVYVQCKSVRLSHTTALLVRCKHPFNRPLLYSVAVEAAAAAALQK